MQSRRLKLIPVRCAVCGSDDAAQIGAGFDYEYCTSDDKFSAMQCKICELVYLNPRPAIEEFPKIYPSEYHAFDFAETDYGVVYRIRERLEARRLLSWCDGLPNDARILDVGCGDGFHLKILKKYGGENWQLEGVDLDERAARAAEKSNLKIHHGDIENLNLPENFYDLALMIQTVEHLEKPFEILSAVKRVLKHGGRLVLVTDNTGALDFKFFKRAVWGGYHFPRHWNLFNRNSLTRLAEKVGFEIADLTTQVSPVNWVYSIHNGLVAANAPRFFINRFTLKSTVSLSVFTSLDIILQKIGRGALLRAILRKP